MICPRFMFPDLKKSFKALKDFMIIESIYNSCKPVNKSGWTTDPTVLTQIKFKNVTVGLNMCPFVRCPPQHKYLIFINDQKYWTNNSCTKWLKNFKLNGSNIDLVRFELYFSTRSIYTFDHKHWHQTILSGRFLFCCYYGV